MSQFHFRIIRDNFLLSSGTGVKTLWLWLLKTSFQLLVSWAWWWADRWRGRLCTGLQPCLLLEANSNGGMSSRVTSPGYPSTFEYGASQLVQTADTQESPTLIIKGSCLFPSSSTLPKLRLSRSCFKYYEETWRSWGSFKTSWNCKCSCLVCICMTSVQADHCLALPEHHPSHDAPAAQQVGWHHQQVSPTTVAPAFIKWRAEFCLD